MYNPALYGLFVIIWLAICYSIGYWVASRFGHTRLFVPVLIIMFVLIFLVSIMITNLVRSFGLMDKPDFRFWKAEPWVNNIQLAAIGNIDFSLPLQFGKTTELSVMSLAPGQNSGDVQCVNSDQVLRVERGEGQFNYSIVDSQTLKTMNSGSVPVTEDMLMFVPSGTRHNVVNTNSTQPLKLSIIGVKCVCDPSKLVDVGHVRVQAL